MLELECLWVILEGSPVNRIGGLAALAEESVNDPVEGGALLASRVQIEVVQHRTDVCLTALRLAHISRVHNE